MVLRSQSVGEQDVADQQGAFCDIADPGRRTSLRPGSFFFENGTRHTPLNCAEIVNARIPAPARRRSAYSYSPRSDAATASDLRGSTLRTGYCDREIDEDRL